MKFLILINFLNSSQGECSVLVILSVEAGYFGFSLNNKIAGNANTITQMVLTAIKTLISPNVASPWTKIGPIANPSIPPIIKAKLWAEIATVLYSGGNQRLLIDIVAICTTALVEAIKRLPTKTQVKFPSSMKMHLKRAPKIYIPAANFKTVCIFIYLYM